DFLQGGGTGDSPHRGLVSQGRQPRVELSAGFESQSPRRDFHLRGQGGFIESVALSSYLDTGTQGDVTPSANLRRPDARNREDKDNYSGNAHTCPIVQGDRA